MLPCGLGGASILASMFRRQENSVGVVGRQRDYCLPDLQTFKKIYKYIIYKNAMVLLWSIKDPLKIKKKNPDVVCLDRGLSGSEYFLLFQRT